MAALQAGHSVRALARSVRRIPVDHPKLEKMTGDALQMATVKRALTGVDVVTQSLGVSAGPEIIRKTTHYCSTARPEQCQGGFAFERPRIARNEWK